MTRTGKIARLPCDVREELNHRIRDGEKGKRLVVWLNSLPRVQEVLRTEFGGTPIREQNISEWKKGGYGDWRLQHDALEMVPLVAKEAKQLIVMGQGQLSDHMSVWLTGHLMAVVRRLAATDLTDAAKWKLLHEACGDIVALRRGDHSGESLRIDQERANIEMRAVELRYKAIELQYKDVELRYKKKIVIGLETLMKHVNELHPKAKATMLTLINQIKGSLDTVEGAA